MTSLKNKTMTINKTVTDGLNTLKNIHYNWNLETNLLDISNFTCSYLPDDNTLFPNNQAKTKVRQFGNMFKKNL
jgi:hypothetical protein